MRKSGSVSPLQWAETFANPPAVEAAAPRLNGGILRRWSQTSSDIFQPPLDRDYVALHLGGPKRVTRTGGGRTVVADVSVGDTTIVPAGSSFAWRTEGPVDYAHIYVSPSRLARVMIDVFDRDPGSSSLTAGIGAGGALLGALFTSILAAANDPADDSLYMATLYEAFMVELVRGSARFGPSRHHLAPNRLARVRAFVEAELHRAIALEELASVAGLSAYHFSRAFRTTTGFSPCAFVTDRRIAEASRRLRAGDESVAAIGEACGFTTSAHFSTVFRRSTGMTPRRYRAAV